MNFLMKPEESAECHQTLSSQMGSGHEIIDYPRPGPPYSMQNGGGRPGSHYQSKLHLSKYWSPKAFMEAEKFAFTQD